MQVCVRGTDLHAIMSMHMSPNVMSSYTANLTNPTLAICACCSFVRVTFMT